MSATLFLASCGREDDSPEAQIRLFVAAAEEAAEKRDAGAIKKLISDQYTDDRKRTKEELVRVTAGYFLRHRSIHLFSHIGSLNFPDPKKAEMELYVAMAGRPITAAEMLLDVQADLYRFDMVLAREGNDWRLFSAEWRQATIEDFLPEETQ